MDGQVNEKRLSMSALRRHYHRERGVQLGGMGCGKRDLVQRHGSDVLPQVHRSETDEDHALIREIAMTECLDWLGGLRSAVGASAARGGNVRGCRPGYRLLLLRGPWRVDIWPTVSC